MKATTPQSGPSVIVVTQVDTHYLVRIPNSMGERVRKITGAQWDGNRKMWAIEKSVRAYEALKSEFEATADVFAVHPPVTDAGESRRQKPISPGLDEEEDLSVDLGPAAIAFTEEEALVGSQEGVQGIMDEISGLHRMLQDIAKSQKELAGRIDGMDAPGESETLNDEVVQVLPELLDINILDHLLLLERALIGIGFFTTNHDQRFMNWIVKQKPLQMPAEFVQNTHELLKTQLEKITGNTTPRTPFWELVKEARDKDLIYSEQDDPVRPIPILSNLNAIRNQFAHSRHPLGQSGRYTRAVLYLMNLSLVWNRIIIDEESVEAPPDGQAPGPEKPET